MLQQEKPDDYVVGTGENHSIQEFVQKAFAHVGIIDWEKYVIIDPRFKRPAEVPNLKSNPEKVKKTLGWEPKMSFEELVKTMVDADMERYSKKQDR